MKKGRIFYPERSQGINDCHVEVKVCIRKMNAALSLFVWSALNCYCRVCARTKAHSAHSFSQLQITTWLRLIRDTRSASPARPPQPISGLGCTPRLLAEPPCESSAGPTRACRHALYRSAQQPGTLHSPSSCIDIFWFTIIWDYRCLKIRTHW